MRWPDHNNAQTNDKRLRAKYFPSYRGHFNAYKFTISERMLEFSLVVRQKISRRGIIFAHYG